MLLKYLSMTNPVNRTIQVVPAEGFDPLYREIYGPMNLTLFVGPNGSGKTTAMSLIARIFQYLERHHERIPGEFHIQYEITYENNRHQVIIIGGGGEVTIKIDEGAPRRIARWSKPLREGEVPYQEIESFLPANVVVMAFSTRGEYPDERPASFLGDKRVDIFDLGKVYGKNHFKFGSLSRGIAKLTQMFLAHDIATHTLSSLLGITFLGKVQIYAPVEIDDTPEWVEVNDLLIEQELSDQIYFNDLLLQRNNRRLSLATMSSGEKLLFVRLLSLLSSVRDNSLILIEEPELHLDPSWVKQWITLLHSLFGNKDAHFVVSTHSGVYPIFGPAPELVLFLLCAFFVVFLPDAVELIWGSVS